MRTAYSPRGSSKPYVPPHALHSAFWYLWVVTISEKVVLKISILELPRLKLHGQGIHQSLEKDLKLAPNGQMGLKFTPKELYMAFLIDHSECQHYLSQKKLSFANFAFLGCCVLNMQVVHQSFLKEPPPPPHLGTQMPNGVGGKH